MGETGLGCKRINSFVVGLVIFQMLLRHLSKNVQEIVGYTSLESSGERLGRGH